ncbi:DUF262 domain-containing protein [Cryobacterium sp. Hb1]|uniref:GmrSD restriction endonuclease domain-containing protein n=1 Tax=Cryobacterium sp. Hb1 TaxID=1259147 RepID=UPI00141B987F|nr:DUF262 domain-containing protein [Cryobacterium sp. Hb1]
MKPLYQREDGIWSKAKQQLFIDSVVNGYDIPKIYMHKVDPNRGGFEYAVVDGKQRVSTLLTFIDGNLEFAEDFSYSGIPCSDPPRPGQKFSELAEATKEIIKENSLDVVLIHTADEDEIEELFSRLNNGEKLNAAESRNALRGKMNEMIRSLATERFFTEKLKFANTRYSHYEVACKLLYLEQQLRRSGGLGYVDLKKKYLDAFVADNAALSLTESTRLMDAVKAQLRAIEPVFDRADLELSKQSYPQLMFLFCRQILDRYGASDLKARMKSFLTEFRLERATNLTRDEDHRDAELSEYGRLTQQGTNDAGSMKSRVEILTKRFLRANPEVELLDPRRAFTLEERWVLWHFAGKKCQSCRVDLENLDDMDGDHIVWHSEGGPTSLANARALCIKCNRAHLAEEIAEEVEE